MKESPLSASSDCSPQILELLLAETSSFNNCTGPDSWAFQGSYIQMEMAQSSNLGFAFWKSYLYFWVSNVDSVHSGEVHREDAVGMQTIPSWRGKEKKISRWVITIACSLHLSGADLDDSCDNPTAALRVSFLCGVVLMALPVNQMPAERLQSYSTYYRGT